MTRSHRPELKITLPASIRERVFRAAELAGVSPSRWATDVIAEKVGVESVLELSQMAQDAPETPITVVRLPPAVSDGPGG